MVCVVEPVAGEAGLEKPVASSLSMCHFFPRHFRRETPTCAETRASRACEKGPVIPLAKALEW